MNMLQNPYFMVKKKNRELYNKEYITRNLRKIMMLLKDSGFAIYDENNPYSKTRYTFVFEKNGIYGKAYVNPKSMKFEVGPFIPAGNFQLVLPIHSGQFIYNSVFYDQIISHGQMLCKNNNQTTNINQKYLLAKYRKEC